MNGTTSLARDLFSSTSASPAFATPEIIFNVVPFSEAQGLLGFLFLTCIALGAVLVELFNHLEHDIQLIRKPGWKQPVKLTSRIAYLLCRVLPPIALSSFIFYLSLKNISNCARFADAITVMGMFIFDAVALIFVQRTMALYSWKRSVVVPLTMYYVVFVASSAISAPFWAIGYRLPFFDFCTFDTRRHETRTMVTNLVGKALSMGLDLIIILLTLHRLLDGGLPSLWRKRGRRVSASDWKGQGISSLLIRQGFHFYVLQLASDIFLVASWWGFDNMALQGIGTPLAYSIPPIAATAAFRDIGKKHSGESRITERSSRVDASEQ